MSKDRPKYKQIIDAAVEVIAENGYHLSQVSKIASKANVADGTIYLYFKNKEDLLISVFREKLGSFIEKIEKNIREKHTANEQLYTLIEMHLTQLAKSPHLAIITQLELRQSKKEIRAEINVVLKAYLDVIDRIVELGINEGHFRTDVHPRLIRQMIFGTIDETVTNWVMKSQKYNIIEQIEDVHKLLISGIKK